MSFRDLGLAEPLLRAVAAAGYSNPTPIQTASIPHVVAGRDVLGTAQTGTGKTAAFALPLLHRLMTTKPQLSSRRPLIRALSLSPTRELACQIGESFRTYGRDTWLRSTTIFGGVGQGPQARALRDGVDILVATPGRLLDLVEQRLVDLSHVEIFVLDEADRMLDMGFMPDIRRVVGLLPTVRQTVLFSATMPGPIAELANSLLDNPARIRIAPVAETTDLIRQSVCFVGTKQKPLMLTKFIKTQTVERALVFTRTKRGADRVVQELARSGIRAEAIHGNKSQSHRQRVLANFKSRRTPILIATDLAARGIDVEGISHVFNYDLPHEPETYVHRIGRTGRAGAAGAAVAFCDPAERKLLSAIERLTRLTLAVEKSLPIEPHAEGRPQNPSPASHGPHRHPQHRPAATRGERPARSGRPKRPRSALRNKRRSFAS
jgi:ATP-dependent RNA helicase RhlE